MAYNEHKTSSQNNYGWNLTWNATGKFPIIAKRIWKKLADLQAWVNDPNDTAVKGLIVSVCEDTAENNGIYIIESVGDGKVNGVVTKQADKASIDNALDNVDLKNYYTKDEVDLALQNIDLDDYYTKQEIDTALDNIDLADYYTKTEVDEALSNIDLTDYYTKEEVDELLSDVGVSGDYATEDYVDSAVSEFNYKINQKLSRAEAESMYQPKGDYLTEIPSEYVNETKLNNIVSDLADKETVDKLDNDVKYALDVAIDFSQIADDAKTTATAAKNAIATLEGLSDANTSALIAAEVIALVEQNTLEIQRILSKEIILTETEYQNLEKKDPTVKYYIYEE